MRLRPTAYGDGPDHARFCFRGIGTKSTTHCQIAKDWRPQTPAHRLWAFFIPVQGNTARQENKRGVGDHKNKRVDDLSFFIRFLYVTLGTNG